MSTRGQRTQFRLARAEPAGHPHGAAATGWRVQPLGGASSADVFTAAAANCYLRIPPGDIRLAAGEPVLFEWTGPESLG